MAPIPIELAIKEICPLVSNTIVVGDGERYLSALLTFKTEVSMTTGKLTNELSRESLLFLVTRLECTAKSVDEAR